MVPPSSLMLQRSRQAWCSTALRLCRRGVLAAVRHSSRLVVCPTAYFTPPNILIANCCAIFIANCIRLRSERFRHAVGTASSVYRGGARGNAGAVR